ncbi:MAG: hypothetical protein AAFQ54_09610 [Pseudomonadota bacterium]
MILKIVTLFLIVIAVMAMFGRLRFPGQERLQRLTAKKCKTCAKPRIGSGPLLCGRTDCPGRKG